MKKRILGALIVACFSVSIMAQSVVTFTAEQLTVSPDEIASAKCVQVGLYLTYTGGDDSFSALTMNVDYTLPSGTFLSADPSVAFFQDNAGLGLNDGNGATPGGGDLLSMSAGTAQCTASADIINGVTMSQAAAANFLPVTNNALVYLPTITPTGTTGHIQLNGAGAGWFDLTAGTHLIGVIEFPLAAYSGNGQIDLVFTPGSDTNFVQIIGTTYQADLVDGYVQVFETIDCGDGENYAVFEDQNGTNTGTTETGDSSMNISFHDPAIGGNGGELVANVHYGAGVIGFQVVGDDGYDSGLVTPDGTSPDELTLDPLDGSAATTTYTVTFFVTGLDGNPAPGRFCSMNVGWLPATCTAVWVNNGINTGTNSTYTVTMTNPMATSGIFGSVASSGTPTGITLPRDIVASMNSSAAPVGANVEATFLVIDEVIQNGDWSGTWTTSGVSSPSGDETTCPGQLGFECPTMTSVEVTPNPADIGGDLVVTFEAENGLTFDLEYNGNTTTNVTSPYTLTGAADGDDVDVTVTANGFGPSGDPCSDSMDGAVTFADAVCMDVTYDPEMPPEGYSLAGGFPDINLTVQVSGATEVTIGGNACTPDVDPTANETVNWTLTGYTVVGPASLAVVATNPNGTVTNCDDIPIEVDCTEANIASMPTAGATGDIVVEGIAGIDYEIWYSPICGQNQFDVISSGSYVGDVTIESNGQGVLAGVTILNDVCYYVVCSGDIIASSSSLRTVPTMGEWGTAIFVVLVMFAGLVILRKRN